MKNNPRTLLIGLLAGILTTIPNIQAGQIPLVNTWDAYNPAELLVLSNQSSSGFTAYISTNTLGNGVVYLPKIFQTFPDVPFTNNGVSVEVSFDVVFNDPCVNSGSWRFALCNTNVNEEICALFGMGEPSGTMVRARMQPNWKGGITLDPLAPGVYEPTNWNNAFNVSFTLTGDLGLNSSPSSHLGYKTPNNIPLGQPETYTNVIHHFRYSVERTPGQLLQTIVWTNSAGPDFIGDSAYYDELSNSTNSPQTWQQVNAFAFGSPSANMFYAPTGSYTIENLTVSTGYRVTSCSRDLNSGDVNLAWETTPYDSEMGVTYNIQYSTDLDSWSSLASLPGEGPMDVKTGGYWANYTDSGVADQTRFYRVQRIYP